MTIIGSFRPIIGETTTIINHSATAVFYRVEFAGAGSVKFIVLPGASFDLVALDGVINVNIDEVTPGGIAPA